MKRTDSILQQFYMSRLPKAQGGLSIPSDITAKNDGTYLRAKPRPLTKAEYEENQRISQVQKEGTEKKKQKVLAQRKKAIQTKGTIQEKNFNIGEKFRLFPGSVGGAGQVFDDFLNPFKFVGDMASNIGNSRTLGEAALNIALTAGAGAVGFDPLGTGLKSSAFKEARTSFPRFIDDVIDDVSYTINKPKTVDKITNKNLYKELGAPLDIKEGINNQGVYSLRRFPDHVVKFEPVESISRGLGYPEYKTFDFINAMKNIKDKPNIAKVKNQINLEDNKRALIMNRVTDGFRPLDLTPINYRKMPDEAIRKMYYDLKDVVGNDLGFDFFGNNYTYNPTKKEFSLFDFSPQFKPGSDGNSRFWIYDVLGNTNRNMVGNAEANKNLKTAIISKLVNDHRIAGQNLYNEIGTGFTLRSQNDISKLLNKGEDVLHRKLYNALKDVDIYQQGGLIIDPRGQWAHPGKVTRIPGSKITMQGVRYPVRGVGSNGQEQMMYPGQEYEFPGAEYVDEYPIMKKGGQMIKRKDGSYSQRGLWDNIRANKGSGKKPTKEMLEQEKKINMKKYRNGGVNNQGFEALPEYVQAKILADMGYGGYHNPYMQTGGQPGLSFWNASKTSQGAVTPTGMSNYFNDNKQGFDEASFIKKMQDLNLDTSSNLSLQQDMMRKYPDLVNQVMSEYGNTNAGRFDDGIIGARVINAASKIPSQTKQVPPPATTSTYKNPNVGYVVNVRGDDKDGAYYFPSSENFDKLSSVIPGSKEYRNDYKGATVNMTNANFMKQYGNNYKEALGQAYKRNPQNPEQYIPMQRNGGSTWSGNAWYEGGGEPQSLSELYPAPQNFQGRPLDVRLPVQEKSSKKSNSYKGVSIIDYLNSEGYASDYNTRKQLADAANIKNYRGTAEQNMQLLSMLLGQPYSKKSVSSPSKKSVSSPSKKSVSSSVNSSVNPSDEEANNDFFTYAMNAYKSANPNASIIDSRPDDRKLNRFEVMQNKLDAGAYDPSAASMFLRDNPNNPLNALLAFGIHAAGEWPLRLGISAGKLFTGKGEARDAVTLASLGVGPAIGKLASKLPAFGRLVRMKSLNPMSRNVGNPMFEELTLENIFSGVNKHMPSIKKVAAQYKYDMNRLAQAAKTDKKVAKLLQDAAEEEEIIMGIGNKMKPGTTMPWNKFNKRAQGNINDLYERSNYQTGGAYVPEYVEMAYGGIHLDPAKKGTFKAQATRMGMGVQEAAAAILNAPEEKYSPAMRKKANFARNFAKQDGGLVDGAEMEVTPEQAEWLKSQGYEFEII